MSLKLFTSIDGLLGIIGGTSAIETRSQSVGNEIDGQHDSQSDISDSTVDSIGYRVPYSERGSPWYSSPVAVSLKVYCCESAS